MKIYRALVVVLSVLVVWLAWLQLRSGKTAGAPPPQAAAEQWRTNTVDQWHTNTVTAWRTNTLERWHTNTVVQHYTNEVVKEVAARLSPAVREAATVGYRYLNAPLSANSSDSFYRVSPVAVQVSINTGDKRLRDQDENAVKGQIEAALQARSIPVQNSAPHHLSVSISPAWTSDLPRVALLEVRVELKEKVALRRQGEVLQCEGVVWSTAGAKLVRTVNLPEELKACVQEQVEKFCNDYQKAKETENAIKSRLPSLPKDFLPEA